MGAKKDGCVEVWLQTAVFDFALIALPGISPTPRTQILERTIYYFHVTIFRESMQAHPMPSQTSDYRYVIFVLVRRIDG
jgi:hypothetical protein